MSETLRIAVQKSGRLYEGSMKLLKECGIEVSNGNNQLRVQAANFPVEIFFLRDDDIPEYVQDAVADIGFVGENVVKEKNKLVDPLEKLGFGKCRLSLAIPKSGSIKTPADLEGKRIATSYPVILGDYLQVNKINASIHEISGSVEIAPRIGLADAIGTFDDALAQLLDSVSLQPSPLVRIAASDSTSSRNLQMESSMNDRTDPAAPDGKATDPVVSASQPAATTAMTVADAVEIAQTCTLAGRTDLIAGFLEAQTDPAQVRNQLLAAQADASPEIVSRIDPQVALAAANAGHPTSPHNPLVQAVKSRLGSQ